MMGFLKQILTDQPPLFKKMIKDMSRLGRDYIETGELIKKHFPKITLGIL